MRIVFAGTPDFARIALQALDQAGHDVALVLTQPDRPSGRGMKLKPSEVKAYALSRQMKVLTPRSLSREKDPEGAKSAIEAIRQARCEVMVVAAFGMIVPPEVLEIPSGTGEKGDIRCINIHASLLPRWRGAAPAARAIEAGDTVFGVTLMKMDEGLDTGDIITQKAFTVDRADTAQTLTDKAARAGALEIVRALSEPEKLTARPQPQEGATYAKKLLKEESRADWSQSAEELARKIRAFTPFPGLKSFLNGVEIRLVEGLAAPGAGRPGEVISVQRDALTVACGSGALRLTALQRPGRPKMGAEAFLQGFKVLPGECFL